MRTLKLGFLSRLGLCTAVVVGISCSTVNIADSDPGPVSFSPGTLRLDTAFVGERSASGVVVVKNRAQKSLTVEDFTGDCPSEVTWSIGDSRLSSDESMNVTFRFDPKQWSGETSCSLTPVISTEPDAKNSILTIIFSADEASCALSAEEGFDFGQVPLGTSIDRQLTISNTTTEQIPANQFEYEFQNPSADCRLFPMDPSDQKRVLGPNGSKHITVRFQPDALGTFECRRELESWRVPPDGEHPSIANQCPTEVVWRGTGEVGPAAWSACTPGGINDYHAVSGLSGSEIYVAGDGGSVVASDGNCEWLPFGTPPPDVNLKDIWVGVNGAEKAIWAVGNIPPGQGLNRETGTILRSDGGPWAKVDEDDLLTYGAVWGSGFDDVYFGGFGIASDFPNAKRWNGGGFDALFISDWRVSPVTGVSGTASDDVWAVLGQDAQSLFRFHGGQWESQTQPFMTKPLNDVWAIQGPDFYAVYAVGKDGAIYHYDGNIWTDESIADETRDFHGVWVSTTGQVIVVGEGQAIYRGHVTGSPGWTLQNPPADL